MIWVGISIIAVILIIPILAALKLSGDMSRQEEIDSDAFFQS